jgi:hypothetical protein
VQSLESLNALDDHDDKYLQDHEILVGSGPSSAHWLGSFRFVDLIHEAQNLYEGTVIIDHSILQYINNMIEY